MKTFVNGSTGKVHSQPREVLPISLFLDHHSGMGRRMNVSDLCNGSFPSTFNASGFHSDILSLRPGESGYGVDNCVRDLDFREPDEHHKAQFLMGIFATSIKRETDHRDNFTDPARHEQFFGFQRSVVGQFFRFITDAGVRLDEVTVTFFDGGNVGGGKRLAGDRDGYLSRQYAFRPDEAGMEAVSRYIDTDRIFPVRSILNIDIRPEEGALVGPRIEVAVRGFEIATIVFDYYKIENRKLVPIDYIGGYAIGMERLQAALTEGGNLYNVGILGEARALLDAHVPGSDGLPKLTGSPLIAPAVRQLLSSTEALLHLSRAPREEIEASGSRKRAFAELQRSIHTSARDMALKEGALAGFVHDFAGLIRRELPGHFGEVHPQVALKVLGLE